VYTHYVELGNELKVLDELKHPQKGFDGAHEQVPPPRRSKVPVAAALEQRVAALEARWTRSHVTIPGTIVSSRVVCSGIHSGYLFADKFRAELMAAEAAVSGEPSVHLPPNKKRRII
jgi:hypothetical protein